MFGLIHAFFAIHMRADQIVGGTAINFLALGVTGYFYIQIYGLNGTPGTGVPYIPDVKLSFLDHIPPNSYGEHSFWYNAIGHLNLMTWLLFALVIASYFFMFRTSIGLRLRSVGEHPRAAETVGIDVYKVRYAAVILSGTIASLGGAYLAVGYVHSFTENMTAGRGFIGLAALISGGWRPARAFAFALLFGFFGGLSRPDPGLRLRAAGAGAGAALRRHADRRDRRDRQVDPTRGCWTPVRQAVAPAGRATRARSGRSCAGSSRSWRVPAGIVLAARELRHVTLIDSSGSVAVAAAARLGGDRPRPARARARADHARPGRGEGAARVGRALRHRRRSCRRDRGARARLLRALLSLFAELSPGGACEPRSAGMTAYNRRPVCSRSATASARRALRKELDFPELEQGTKIRAKYLRALEDENFEVLPVGDVRQGLPAHVRRLPRARRAAVRGRVQRPLRLGRRGARAARPQLRLAGARPPQRRRRRGLERNVVWFALVGIAVVTALVIAAWRFGGSGKQNLPLSTPGRRRRSRAAGGPARPGEGREHAPDHPRGLRRAGGRSGTGR